MSRDRRDFTEAEYKKELDLNHIPIPPGTTAGRVYSMQPASVKEKPKSGVFRDFVEYGVHPTRVVVQRLLLTIPFLISSLSADQLALEITNQKQREVKKEKDKNWPEEEEVKKSVLKFQPNGAFKLPPTSEAAYDLIKTLKERKRHVDWTPALQNFMSAANLFFFRRDANDFRLQKFFIPPRDRAMMELTPLISKKFFISEIKQRILKDPGHWGSNNPETVTVQEMAYLIGELMTDEAYTGEMREIIGWYKTVYERNQMAILLENVIRNQEQLIVTLRPKTSLLNEHR